MVRPTLTRSAGGVVCCLDMGTTHVKAAFFDDRGRALKLAHAPVPAPSPGSPPHEFDADEHVRIALSLVRHFAREQPSAACCVKAVAVTGQRASIVPLYHDRTAPALGWPDARGADLLPPFLRRLGPATFRRITGLQPSALWSLSKILRLQQAPLKRRPARYALLNDFVLSRLGAPGIITDFSSASLTGLLDLATLRWSTPLLRAASLAPDQLPALAAPATIIGSLSSRAAARCGLLAGTPLILAGGDQQCAALGTAVLDDTEAGLCLGTAAVISCPTARPRRGRGSGLFCTAHVVPGRWMLEGIHNACGSSLDWAARVMHSPASIPIATAAACRPDAPVFLPFLSGMGSPDFDPAVRGAFVHLNASHTAQDLSAAVALGNTLELRRILEAMGSGAARRTIIVSGGKTALPGFMQLLADVTGRPLRRAATSDATLLGAAILAWTALDRYGSLRETVRACASLSRSTVQPRLSRRERERLFSRYRLSVEAVRRAAHG